MYGKNDYFLLVTLRMSVMERDFIKIFCPDFFDNMCTI